MRFGRSRLLGWMLVLFSALHPAVAPVPAAAAAPVEAAVARPSPPPGLRDDGRPAWLEYLGSAGRKAFAMGPKGRLAWTASRATVEAAAAGALRACERKGDTCRIISIDGGPPH